MDFASYSEIALDLANVEPYDDPDDDGLLDVLRTHFPKMAKRLNDADLPPLRELHARLRTIMQAEDEAVAVEQLNILLLANPINPEISGHSHDDGREDQWHLHLSRDTASVSAHAAAVSAMGLTAALIDHGFDRRGTCSHTTCRDVYIDGSPGGTRRYCSDSCQNRANVAAWRARKRAEAQQDASAET